MKLLMCLAAALTLLIPTTAFSQNPDVRWGAAARFNAGHDEEKDVPFDGDWSYGLVYEYREPQAYFQFLMSYAPKISFTEEFDGKSGQIESVLTPELNLLFTDGAWQGGMGVLKHHVRREDGGTWSPIFWQLLLGLSLGQRSSLALDVMACYQFPTWGDISNINVKDLDVRIALTRSF